MNGNFSLQLKRCCFLDSELFKQIRPEATNLGVFLKYYNTVEYPVYLSSEVNGFTVARMVKQHVTSHIKQYADDMIVIITPLKYPPTLTIS